MSPIDTPFGPKEGIALSEAMKIHDLKIDTISPSDPSTTPLLSFEDHLLRRFGELELVRKSKGDPQALRIRRKADEIWFLLDGSIHCLVRDLRPGSPSENTELELDLSEPSRLLIPFGVAFGWQALSDSSLMLRLSTHASEQPDDGREIPWEGSA